MTIEQDVAALTTATTNLLSAVNVAKVTLDAKVTTATTQAANAQANATQVASVNADAANQASAAAASALAASNARDLSIAAWAASTAPAETLAAISQSIHAGAIVKSIIYDTSKDSDSGAWRKRCTDKSWFTETLGGNRWIGQRASVGAAWTAAGSTTGAVYQSTADGKYYSPTSATVQTEVFRGIAREFPEQVSIVAETSRVVIYDLTVPSCPMWMVFTTTSASDYLLRTNNFITSVASLNGLLVIGVSKADVNPVWSPLVDFIKDSIDLLAAAGDTASSRSSVCAINARNTTLVYGKGAHRAAGIVTSRVNDIAVTVLEGAPIDPATGLPVPTIYVATPSGISTIKDNGMVVNDTSTLGVNANATVLGLTRSGRLIRQWNDGNRVGIAKVSAPTSSADYDVYLSSFVTGAAPQMPLANYLIYQATRNALGYLTGLVSLKENPSDRGKTMVAAITNAYNSGWQIGDSRGAWLADTVAETIAAPDLVTNGGFATASGWGLTPTSANIGSSISGGTANLYSTDGTYASIVQEGIAFVVGKTYVFSITVLSMTGNGSGITIGLTGTQSASCPCQATGTFSFSVTVTSPNPTLEIKRNGSGAVVNATFDNISVKLADPDRSVKSNGLSIVGSLTKTAVAAGAQLVAYSGFSAANYLEQPYSANLDFGTGDFCVMGWVSPGGSNYTGFIDCSLVRNNTNDPGYRIWQSLDATFFAVGTSLITAEFLPQTLFGFLVLVRNAGVMSAYINGALIGSTPAPSSVSVNASTVIGGYWYQGVLAGTNWASRQALWRISATVPSQSQIEQIYRDELPLFAPGAQCTIAGTSTAVTALAYDESTDLLHVGTSWGRSAFRGLLRTESEATTTGAITSLSAAQGAVLTGGTSAKIYQPALQLRDELSRKEEARRALGKVPVFIDITATAAQTAFVLAKGYTIKALYRNGVLMRETTTGVFWTRSNDGYQETATLSVGATVGDWISLMCVRSN